MRLITYRRLRRDKIFLKIRSLSSDIVFRRIFGDSSPVHLASFGYFRFPEKSQMSLQGFFKILETSRDHL